MDIQTGSVITWKPREGLDWWKIAICHIPASNQQLLKKTLLTGKKNASFERSWMVSWTKSLPADVKKSPKHGISQVLGLYLHLLSVNHHPSTPGVQSIHLISINSSPTRATHSFQVGPQNCIAPPGPGANSWHLPLPGPVLWPNQRLPCHHSANKIKEVASGMRGTVSTTCIQSAMLRKHVLFFQKAERFSTRNGAPPNFMARPSEWKATSDIRAYLGPT